MGWGWGGGGGGGLLIVGSGIVFLLNLIFNRVLFYCSFLFYHHHSRSSLSGIRTFSNAFLKIFFYFYFHFFSFY